MRRGCGLAPAHTSYANSSSSSPPRCQKISHPRCSNSTTSSTSPCCSDQTQQQSTAVDRQTSPASTNYQLSRYPELERHNERGSHHRYDHSSPYPRAASNAHPIYDLQQLHQPVGVLLHFRIVCDVCSPHRRLGIITKQQQKIVICGLGQNRFTFVRS